MNLARDFKYPTRITMENLIKEGDIFNVASSCFDNHITRLSDNLAQKYKEANFEIIHAPLYLDDIFKVYLENFKDLKEADKIFSKDLSYHSPLHDVLHPWCSYYENKENKQGDMISRLNSLLNKKVNVFIYFDLHEYLINDDIHKKHDKLEYDTHSTCCLLYLDKNNNYNVYYFNSHGEALLNKHSFSYDKYITKKRYKKINLDLPLDLFIIDNLFKYINAYNKTYQLKAPYINYKPDEKHNYCGPNLQEGDKYGVCFVFPFLFFINLILNFRIKFTYTVEKKNYKFTSFQKLMKNNNIEKIIKIIMCNYDGRLKELCINDKLQLNNKIVDSEITNTIENQGTKYTKYLYSITLNIIKTEIS